MRKSIFGAVLASICLAACGGGGDSSTSKPLTVSFYGLPLVSQTGAVAHGESSASDAAASDATASSAAAASDTVETLQAALAARGVTADVSVGVMDGTTLHQIVMGQDNGLPPTPDQFKTEPSEWMIVNFQLDDMVTPVTDPSQQAAINQFIQDLTVFVDRAAVSGKRVFAVEPIQTCDVAYASSAAYGLIYALTQVHAAMTTIGSIPFTIAWGSDGQPLPNQDLSHLGTDCRTPDSYLLNQRVQSVADNIAAQYEANVASSTVAASAPAVASQ